jgi:hypothetical protein
VATRHAGVRAPRGAGQKARCSLERLPHIMQNRYTRTWEPTDA